MTTEQKPVNDKGRECRYGFGTRGFSDPDGYSWEIIPVGTRKVSDEERAIVLEKLHTYIKGLLTTPSKENL